MKNCGFSKVDLLMQEGVGAVFPGAVLLVIKDGEEAFHRAYGKADIFTGEDVMLGTLFDLASLTKPLATTLCTMALIEDGTLGLQDRLGDLIGVYTDTDKAEITVEHLLRHTSGLPDYRPYYETLAGRPLRARRAQLEKMLAQEGRVTPVGKKTRYSDIGFLILQQVIEKISGRGLSHTARERIFAPLGLSSLHFPGTAPPFPVERYASTEKCPWRKRVLRAEVHDENAFVLGGVAGHAGLFGTAADVGRLAGILSAFLQDAYFPGPFSAETVRLFLGGREGEERALGFDLPDPVNPSCGSHFSKGAFGHLGFTGTSFWIDPDSSLAVVLLTNRIHPSRDNQKIKEFRPQIHDAIALACR